MSVFGTPEERTRWSGWWVSPLFVLALLVIFLVATPLLSPASGLTLKEKLAEKQAELNAAYAEYSKFQDELNALAQKHNAAEIRLAEIDDAINSVENEINKGEKDLAVARAQLADRVVDMYKDGFSNTPVYLEILLGEGDFASILNRLSLLSKLADQDEKLFDQVAAYVDQSNQNRDELQAKREAQAGQLRELEAVQTEMNEKFKSSEGEYQRLRGLVIALRDEVRKAEEAARRAAEEAARRAAAARAAAAAKAASSSSSSSSSSGTTRSSSSSGGSLVQSGFVFPVAGPHSFIDSWGAPRSGGRTHKGTDIMAAQGTPCVACVSGTVSRVTRTDTGLGGITIWLRGSNGYSYYYAHLDGIASGIGSGTSVSAGQTIGWVGHTGNAGTCNHLHFCTYTPSGTAINPYATLRASD
ncbi:MAG: peptidoglycan DD-metalloendopeptidase family protein [Actinobacteria bacterium]|nr:peptidoglycan DD-metalloendopeptidase family protein [Actinomycetota bacterium]